MCKKSKNFIEAKVLKRQACRNASCFTLVGSLVITNNQMTGIGNFVGLRES